MVARKPKRRRKRRVDEVLKKSAHETTQRVMLVDDAGFESGPFIRKFIKRESGLGAAYERIYEAQRAGRTFDHIPQIRECYARESDLVVVMQFVEGKTLQDVVYEHDPSVELASAVFPTICDAVAELHEAFDPPLIHRDLKPSNVMVSGISAGTGAVEATSCKVTIIDFGIARDYREGATTDTVHFGTRDFAPPEQFGFGQTTASSDVYALGMLLFFCLTETMPTPETRTAGFPDARIPDDFRRLIVQATSFDPAQRFNSVRALKAAFENVVTGRSVRPARASRSPQASQPVAQPTQMDAASGQRPATPTIVGRVWNAVVAAFGVFMAVYMTYLLATGGLMSPDGVTYSPGAALVSYLLGLALTALLCFACLDKRRLRERFDSLRDVKAWHCWAAVVLAYLVTTIVRSVIA